MERCQETSQCAPIVTDVTARAAHQRYHGIRSVVTAAARAVVTVAMTCTSDDTDRIQRPTQTDYDGMELRGGFSCAGGLDC